MGTYVQTKRALKVQTPLGNDVLLLTGFSGHESISSLFSFQLTLQAKNSAQVAFDKLLGQKITVELVAAKGQRYFNGICQMFSQGERDDTFTSYQMTIVPQFWLLTRNAQSRIFQQKAVPDILKEVLTGLDTSYELQGSFAKRDYCVQYRETDFNFASRLMEEEGIYYYFKHDNGSHKMVIANTPQSHSALSPEKAVFEELADASHLRKEDRVFSWTKSQELRSGKYTLWDQCFEMPGQNFKSDKTISDSVTVGTVSHKLNVGGNDKFELYDYPGEYAQRFDGISPGGGDRASDLQKISQDGDRTVAIRMQEEAVAGLVVHGSGNCRQFSAGQKFSLERHFNANGSYVVTSVQHHATMPANYRSDGGDGFEYSNSFTAIPAALPYRPARQTPRPFVQGTQTAVVVGPQGEEIFTDKYGRVKVQFPWDRKGKNDADSSCWVRVGTPWAGKQWGMIQIPRIGQEVVVAFEEGDADRPLVVGAVFNAEQMPPYTLPDNKTQSGMKSRSTLKGSTSNFNELRFEDKKDSEQIYFHAETNFDRVVENNDTLKVGASKKNKGNQTIEIFNNQLESVGANGCDQGSQIVEIWNNREVTVGSGKTQCADGSQLVAIFNNEETKIGAGEGAAPDGSQIVEIYNNRTVSLDMGNDSLTIKMGNQTTKISLGASSTEAMQSIELKVGQSSIKLDQTGVTIQGMMITIQGQVQTQIKGLMTQINGDAMLQAKGGITMIN